MMMMTMRKDDRINGSVGEECGSRGGNGGGDDGNRCVNLCC